MEIGNGCGKGSEPKRDSFGIERTGARGREKGDGKRKGGWKGKGDIKRGFIVTSTFIKLKRNREMHYRFHNE